MKITSFVPVHGSNRARNERRKKSGNYSVPYLHIYSVKIILFRSFAVLHFHFLFVAKCSHGSARLFVLFVVVCINILFV